MRRRSLPILLGLILGTCTPMTARAQRDGRGPGTSPGVSPALPRFGGGAAYLPYGGTVGGFVPYRAGPGGGLGVLSSGMRAAPMAGTTGGGAVMAGRGGPAIGRVRGQLTPLAPIRAAGAGMGGGGSLIRRSGPAAGMGVLARPPVGSYPFRPPTRLGGSAASAPSMAM